MLLLIILKYLNRLLSMDNCTSKAECHSTVSSDESSQLGKNLWTPSSGSFLIAVSLTGGALLGCLDKSYTLELVFVWKTWCKASI